MASESVSNVTELPVGKYDAVRTLRHLLAQAERGEIDNVLVICSKRVSKEENSNWASWSDMGTMEVWWLASWLVSYLRRRYFSGKGILEDDEDGGMPI
jgi:hypothetical protein